MRLILSRFDFHVGRFEVTKDIEEAGQLLLNGAGRAGDVPTRVLSSQQHGFASRMPSGSLGFQMAFGGRPSQSLILGGENPEMRPALKTGNSALYDHNGHIVKVIDEGLKIDVKDQTVEIRQGSLKIIVKGNDAFIELDVDKKLYLGGNPDDHVFGNVQTTSGPSINVFARTG